MTKRYLVLGFLILVLLSSCAIPPELIEVRRTEEHLGTFVEIILYAENETIGKAALDDAFFHFQLLDGMLSNYINTSEVSFLNENKYIDNPSFDLRSNIQKAIYYGNLTSGAFDITVQPILDLYTESFTVNGRPPTDEEVQRELKKVDYTRIKYSDERIEIGADQKITLGGLAKGFIVNLAITILQEYGVENALVNAGGDIQTRGKKQGITPWSIALANPRDKEDYISIVKISDKAIVTSGDYERYFDDSMKFHHIVNPKTGYSADELISVTILTDNAFEADALSTSVFVMGPEEGLELIERFNNVEGLLITKDKEIIKSSGW